MCLGEDHLLSAKRAFHLQTKDSLFIMGGWARGKEALEVAKELKKVTRRKVGEVIVDGCWGQRAGSHLLKVARVYYINTWGRCLGNYAWRETSCCEWVTQPILQILIKIKTRLGSWCAPFNKLGIKPTPWSSLAITIKRACVAFRMLSWDSWLMDI